MVFLVNIKVLLIIIIVVVQRTRRGLGILETIIQGGVEPETEDDEESDLQCVRFP